MSHLTKEYWEKLKKIQTELKNKIVTDSWRLTFHQMPETGWMNDPNGAVQFNGLYHLYHQYVPDNPEGGLVHWGHKTSTDMVHFKEEAIFLSPEHEYDKDGVYSGSAFVKDEVIHFFYTGNVKHPGDYDYTYSGREQNTIHVVSKDGFSIDYQEVIIPHEEYPEGFTDHIRDPKVFEKNGKYYMVLGSRGLDHRGKILLYQSDDLYEWDYVGVFLEGESAMGYMWECPDFFESDNQDVLIFSPQGLKPTDIAFQNAHQSGYYLGEVDWENKRFLSETEFQELDKGFDFYAPQTFEDESGRRILWGWMGLGDTGPEYSNPTISRGWQHAMTMPRELSVENGQLYQRPLKEYRQIRSSETKSEITLDKVFSLEVGNQRTFELLIEVDEFSDFLAVSLLEDTTLSYRDGIFTMSHGVSGYGRAERSVECATLKSIHLFVDTSSIEVFLNDGEQVMTSRVYPKAVRDSIVFKGKGKLNVTKWGIDGNL